MRYKYTYHMVYSKKLEKLEVKKDKSLSQQKTQLPGLPNGLKSTGFRLLCRFSGDLPMRCRAREPSFSRHNLLCILYTYNTKCYVV